MVLVYYGNLSQAYVHSTAKMRNLKRKKLEVAKETIKKPKMYIKTVYSVNCRVATCFRQIFSRFSKLLVFESIFSLKLSLRRKTVLCCITTLRNTVKLL